MEVTAVIIGYVQKIKVNGQVLMVGKKCGSCYSCYNGYYDYNGLYGYQFTQEKMDICGNKVPMHNLLQGHFFWLATGRHTKT